jgi:hypothetical protein
LVLDTYIVVLFFLSRIIMVIVNKILRYGDNRNDMTMMTGGPYCRLFYQDPINDKDLDDLDDLEHLGDHFLSLS